MLSPTKRATKQTVPNKRGRAHALPLEMHSGGRPTSRKRKTASIIAQNSHVTNERGNTPSSRRAKGSERSHGVASSTNSTQFKDGKDGLYEWTGGAYRRVCSGVQWLANTVDADGSRPAHVLHIWTLNAACRKIEVPREIAEQPQELARLVTMQGVRLERGKSAARQLSDYLASRPSYPTYTRVLRDGWQIIGDREAYVFGDTAFATAKRNLPIARIPSAAQRIRQGSLEKWNEIALLCRGNPLLITSLCAAFASALLQPLGRNSFGVSFVGKSSTGKTTALRLALATIDSPTALATWASTANGLEALAMQYPHMPLVLDEIGLASHDVASDAAYRLTGSGKLRAVRDGSLAPMQRITSVTISAGEESITARIEQRGDHAKSGQFARFISLPSDDAHGVFAALHGSMNGAAFAEKLNRLLNATHGVAWEPFVKYLASNTDAIKKLHTANLQGVAFHLTKEIEFDASDGVCARVLENFALMFRAGNIARKAKVFPISDTEIVGALRHCLRKWAEQYRQRLVTPTQAILDDVSYFLQRHRHNLPRWADYFNADCNTSIGFTCSLRSGDEAYLIFPGSLDGLKKKHGRETFHRALIDSAWLLPGTDDRPTQQRRFPPPNTGRTAMYVFSKSAIFCD
ncbi:DUF927 domain-containing protein [Paraburkholderia solisilvae]|uniref:DUF927 domain-containing protein n=1 Tax=Paraburkholderia solisilvae TaxID=624376 RepID=A0A6J5EQ75_9BURK|nr:DUF927 domain-containing protein [Paraburkholderia solisilvae]CAB3768619.1 hypothetical protein LMG29739_05348 [Paraburkholderia solisilvae]